MQSFSAQTCVDAEDGIKHRTTIKGPVMNESAKQEELPPPAPTSTPLPVPHPPPPPRTCRIYYATQSGRAKACARRAARIIRQKKNHVVVAVNVAIDDDPNLFSFGAETAADPPTSSNVVHVLFVSTTGDGEQPDNMRHVWRKLLQKSLPSHHLSNVVFALFALGDRAYGDLFCAAGRKLAVRLLQLGATLQCQVGYGDDNTPNGGVFADLDAWLHDDLLPSLPNASPNYPLVGPASSSGLLEEDLSRHYEVSVLEMAESNGGRQQYAPNDEWRRPDSESYRKYMDFVRPRTAYQYRRSRNVLWGYERVAFDGETAEAEQQNDDKSSPFSSLLECRVAQNERLTPQDWSQNTRHVRLEIIDDDTDDRVRPLANRDDNDGRASRRACLPYRAGDVAVILPVNSDENVKRFLTVLPDRVRAMADTPLTIGIRSSANDGSPVLSVGCTPWPEMCTLRGWLTLCADIQALPEREDLRSLATYCDTSTHPFGRDQQDKLVGLSETSESALYVDYILREKRSWADVLHDFDSLRSPQSPLTVEALLALLSPIRPREFSIASSPTLEANRTEQSSKAAALSARPCFGLELCVAKVEGRTPLGRSYHGLCSTYLSAQEIGSTVRLWIRPGTFLGLPLELDASTKWFQTPLLCIGAGTGIAPLRGLIHEREAVRDANWRPSKSITVSSQSVSNDASKVDSCDSCLVFGCRKESCDFYYMPEWNKLCEQGRLDLVTAFSQDQWHKVYVQQVLRKRNEATQLLLRHVMDRGGAIYIAGNPKMARAVKDEIHDTLARELGGDERKARAFLSRLQRAGLYNVEAWS